MEKQLFDWSEWEELNFLSLYFYGCTFITDVGKYKKGDKVSGVCMDYAKGIIIIDEDADTQVTYKLSFLISES